MNKLVMVVSLLTAQATSVLACDLKVESAWIREAPPNAMALAGYAKLTNSGVATLKIQSVSAAAFGSVETHESYTENGLAKMRPVTVEIPTKGSVDFAAGGKHFMLMNPKQPLQKGDVVTLKIIDASGCVTSVPFKVSAPTAGAGTDHSSMDHSKMDHSTMDHSSMKPQ
jgi:hypothetical protein